MKTSRIPRLFSWLLVRITRGVLWRSKPGIVGITGSLGKTTTKEALVTVAKSLRRTQEAPDSLPPVDALLISILGKKERKQKIEELYEESKNSTWFWFSLLLRGLRLLFVAPKGGYPEVVVVEYGEASDVSMLTNIARPTVAVLTPIGDGNHESSTESLRDYARIIEQLPASGFAVMPSDDSATKKIKQRTRAHVLTYGSKKEAHIRVMSPEQHQEKGNLAVTAKLEYGGSTVPIRLENALGPHHATAAAAAACLGIIYGANLIDISEALESYKAPQGALRVIPGIKGTTLIDDAYDAHTLSVQVSLNLLETFPGKRKIVVLGDLIDLGKYSMDAHEELGKRITKSANLLFTVGKRAKLSGDTAKRKLKKENVFSFDEAREAGLALQNELQEGDVILVVGSNTMGLNEVIEEVRGDLV